MSFTDSCIDQPESNMTFCKHTILELGKIVNIKLCMLLYTAQNNTDLHRKLNKSCF
jgi:hypothetical protein